MFIIIGVVVVAVVAIGAFLLVGGGGGGSAGPEQTIRDFVNAAKDKNCTKVVDLMTTNSFGGQSRKKAVSQCEEAMKSGDNPFEGDGSIDDVKLKSQDGDKAVVTVKSTTNGKQTTDDVNLRKEDGKWRIDFSASGLGSGSPEASSDTSDGTTDTTTDFGDGSTDTSTDFGDSSTDTSIDLGDLPEACNPQSSSYDIEECANQMSNGGG
jgi:hypothetical protein